MLQGEYKWGMMRGVRNKRRACRAIPPAEGGLHGTLPTRKPQAFSAAASAASLVIPTQSPAATSSFGATHEPPTQMTFGSDR